MQRTTAVALIVATIVIAALLLVLCGPAQTETGPSPSPSPSLSVTPTPTPTPTVTPAPAAVVMWACHWRRAAMRSWRKWSHARWCLNMPRRAFNSPRPPRVADKAAWTAAGRHWRSMRHLFRVLAA